MVTSKYIKTTVQASKFGTMHCITSVSNGFETQITIFTDGTVLIHNCKNVVIYDADVESVKELKGEAGEYKSFIFKQKVE